MVIPFIDRVSPGFRKRLVGLQRVVDNDHVRAAAGEYTADRCCHARALLGCCKVMDRLAVGEPYRKEPPIPRAGHYTPAVPGQFTGQGLPVPRALHVCPREWRELA